MRQPGILLDRDGTIIVDYHYVGIPERVQFIPGAADAIARFNRAGIPVAIITNQGGVSRGFYPETNVQLVHDYIARELALHGAHVDLFLYSPDHPDGVIPEYTRESAYHKPNPGMALLAGSKLDLDIPRSIVVGDRPSDMQLAGKVGAHGVYLGTTPTSFAHVPFPSLAAAAGYIIERLTSVPQSDFPRVQYGLMNSYFRDYSADLSRLLYLVDYEAVRDACTILRDAYKVGQRVFVAGNGGASAIAEHFICDHTKGVSTDTNWNPQVVSLTSNTALLTAIANDIGYDAVFSYRLQQLAVKPGGIL